MDKGTRRATATAAIKAVTAKWAAGEAAGKGKKKFMTPQEFVRNFLFKCRIASARTHKHTKKNTYAHHAKACKCTNPKHGIWTREAQTGQEPFTFKSPSEIPLRFYQGARRPNCRGLRPCVPRGSLKI